ncbi:hypothetical protein MTR_0030s0060 [Medicago truncatula]|uniref:Uncharacterized protein n=1 Tax=Medicago truncatula TaxID=3880 RepID=G7ZUG2_MEDTR|nr:hypothetical protein MTR_0030s0060 [Medicago truncatula]
MYIVLGMVLRIDISHATSSRMNIRANLTRAKEDNINEVFFLQASQGNQLSVVRPVMTNEEIRKDFLTLAQAMMTQVNQDVGLMVNAIERTMDSILRDFARMNALIFLGFKEECHTAMLNDDMNISRLKGGSPNTLHPDLDAPKKNHFYALQDKKGKRS